jgi:hypothetical protein
MASYMTRFPQAFSAWSRLRWAIRRPIGLGNEGVPQFTRRLAWKEVVQPAESRISQVQKAIAHHEFGFGLPTRVRFCHDSLPCPPFLCMGWLHACPEIPKVAQHVVDLRRIQPQRDRWVGWQGQRDGASVFIELPMQSVHAASQLILPWDIDLEKTCPSRGTGIRRDAQGWEDEFRQLTILVSRDGGFVSARGFFYCYFAPNVRVLPGPHFASMSMRLFLDVSSTLSRVDLARRPSDLSPAGFFISCA